jgi:D-alanyl-D-alanine endopeptidase (penicillin-binding protein 7)
MIGSIVGVAAALAIASPLPKVAQAAAGDQAIVMPYKREDAGLGVRTTARSAFIADLATGKVLYAKNAHQVLPIASITKLVTAMVVLDGHPDLTQPVLFTDADMDRESKVVIPPGESLPMNEVIRLMLVGSVNSAANALARVSAENEAQFVQRMNAKMREFRLKSPVFTDPSGVDATNRASAADVAAILAFASSYPEVRESAKLSEITVRGRLSNRSYTVKSTNLLLSSYLNKAPYGIVAAKTGSLPEAGYCMAQLTKNADGHQIIAVELGSDNHFSRYQDIKALTAWAFQSYTWR